MGTYRKMTKAEYRKARSLHRAAIRKYNKEMSYARFASQAAQDSVRMGAWPSYPSPTMSKRGELIAKQADRRRWFLLNLKNKRNEIARLQLKVQEDVERYGDNPTCPIAKVMTQDTLKMLERAKTPIHPEPLEV